MTVAGNYIAVLTGSCITGVLALLGTIYAGRRAIQSTALTARADLEQEAFTRAKLFYTDVIERQDREIQELTSEVRQLKTEIMGLKALLRAAGSIEPPSDS